MAVGPVVLDEIRAVGVEDDRHGDGSGRMGRQRREKTLHTVGRESHVVVDQKHEIRLGLAKGAIARGRRPHVLRETHDTDLGKSATDDRDALVTRGVIHPEHLGERRLLYRRALQAVRDIFRAVVIDHAQRHGT